MRKTQYDTMIEQVKAIFGESFTIYSTNYYNPGRRYQLEKVHSNSGASIFGANLTKKSFKDALYVAEMICNNMTEEDKVQFWKSETNLKKYK